MAFVPVSHAHTGTARVYAPSHYYDTRNEALAACQEHLAPIIKPGTACDAGPGPYTWTLEVGSGDYPYGGAIAYFHFPPSSCTAGSEFVSPGICANLQSEKGYGGGGCPGGNTGVGNPCDPASGNKWQIDEDYRSKDGALVYSRSYNSLLRRASGHGYNWVATNRLEIRNESRIQVRRANGTGEPFEKDALGIWVGDPDSSLTLIQDATGYSILQPDGTRERYDLFGYIVSETDRSGRTTAYSYDASHRLTVVTGHFGSRLIFGYGTTSRVATVTDPDGKVISYGYDANNNLTRVDYPDGTTKLYHYNEPGLTGGANFPNHLTGISYVDSTGATTRYATYAYDSTGKAARTEHAQTDNGSAQERFTLNYDSATQTTVTDAIGTQEVMTFATNLGVKNLVSKVNQSDGKSVQQVFDGNNNLTCRKDEENRVTTYTYSATNQKLGMTEGLTGDCTNPVNVPGVTRTTTYEYLSPTLDLPRFIRRPSVAAGQTFETEMVYGDAGHPNLPTQLVQRGFTPSGTAVSRAVVLGYNASGQVSSINGPRTDINDVTTLEYYECTTGGACGQLKKVTNALGHITTYDLHDANGRLKQMTDPNGLRTTYTYDPRGRIKTITQIPTSGSTATTQYSYTSWGDVSQVIDPDGVVLNYQYDAAHDLRFIVDAAGNYIHYKYDLKGNRTGEDIYDAGGYLKRTISQAYDLRNHLNQINNAGNITQLLHDAVGNLTSEIDPNNHGTTHQYDALNRLFKTVNALSQETSYSQDINDRPTVVTAPNGLSTQYQYDDLGNLLKEVSPDRRTTNYTHDAAGNVLTVKDARNITTTYTYDALNRVTVQQSSDANTPRYNYYYDGCFRGQLCNVSRSGTGYLILSYDKLGRLSYQLDLGTWLYSTYAYTPGGRLSQITYPSDRIVNYQYDALGRINQVSTTLDDTTTVLAQNLSYYPFGPLNSFSFGNGQYFFMNVDQAYRPTFQRSGPRWKNAFYDPAGNLNALDDINGTAQTFTYSALDELTSASDTQVGNYGSLGYTYLPNGNRETETRNGVASDYSYIGNRLSNTSSLYWLYDTAGNAYWSNYAYVMAYDGYGRMTSALSGAATYEYNPFNQRIRKTAGGITTRFHYGPSGEMLFETGGGGNKAYVYLNGMPLARVDSNSQIYYYHTDQLGAPQVMTDSAGTTVWKASYEPFGKATITTQTIQNNLRLAGQYFDQETGLHYNWHRYYDPKTGRYISSDPIGLIGGLNTYTYVANNPLKWIDPAGLFTIPIHEEVTREVVRAELPDLLRTMPTMVGQVDLRAGSQSPKNSHMHAMCAPGMSPSIGMSKLEEYIEQELSKCTPEGLASALHAAQDKHSPSHQSCQVWHGQSTTPTRQLVGHVLSDLAGRGVRDAMLESQLILQRFKKQCPCGAK